MAHYKRVSPIADGDTKGCEVEGIFVRSKLKSQKRTRSGYCRSVLCVSRESVGVGYAIGTIIPIVNCKSFRGLFRSDMTSSIAARFGECVILSLYVYASLRTGSSDGKNRVLCVCVCVFVRVRVL